LFFFANKAFAVEAAGLCRAEMKRTLLSRDEDQSPLTGVLPKRLIFKTLKGAGNRDGWGSESGPGAKEAKCDSPIYTGAVVSNFWNLNRNSE